MPADLHVHVNEAGIVTRRVQYVTSESHRKTRIRFKTSYHTRPRLRTVTIHVKHCLQTEPSSLLFQLFNVFLSLSRARAWLGKKSFLALLKRH